MKEIIEESNELTEKTFDLRTCDSTQHSAVTIAATQPNCVLQGEIGYKAIFAPTRIRRFIDLPGLILLVHIFRFSI